MDIKKKKQSGTLTVTVSGRIDTVTAPQFQDGVKPDLEGVSNLVIDFADVKYISSAELRVLLSLQKIMNKQGAMKLINVNSAINDVFEVTGFSDILTIETA